MINDPIEPFIPIKDSDQFDKLVSQFQKGKYPEKLRKWFDHFDPDPLSTNRAFKSPPQLVIRYWDELTKTEKRFSIAPVNKTQKETLRKLTSKLYPKELIRGIKPETLITNNNFVKIIEESMVNGNTLTNSVILSAEGSKSHERQIWRSIEAIKKARIWYLMQFKDLDEDSARVWVHYSFGRKQFKNIHQAIFENILKLCQSKTRPN